MADDKLLFELISQDRIMVSQEVDEIYAPGTEGDLGILPHHINFLCSLRPGEFHYRVGNVIEYVAMDGGFLEVLDNKVTVLADSAELGKDINLAEVIKRKEDAEAELNKLRLEDTQAFQAMEIKLKRELIRISVAGHYN